MGSGDKYDDQTEVASPGGKRKFLDSETQLKTSIYEGDKAPATGAPETPTPGPDEPVQERVHRVLNKADELLKGLGSRPDTIERDDDATIPTEEEDDAEERMDDVTELQRPARAAGKKPAAAPHRRSADEETAVAVRKAPLADGSADVSLDVSVDAPLVDRKSTEVDDEMALADAGDVTTQIEAPKDLDGAPEAPTMPGHGAPLSDQPIAPGPLAPPTAPGNMAPPLADSAGDSIPTLSTDQAPPGMPVPAHMQPRPGLTPPMRKTFFGSLWGGIKRMFGGRPPEPPPMAPPDDDDDFSGYGAGTYTVANRHVANRHSRDNKE